MGDALGDRRVQRGAADGGRVARPAARQRSQELAQTARELIDQLRAHPTVVQQKPEISLAVGAPGLRRLSAATKPEPEVAVAIDQLRDAEPRQQLPDVQSIGSSVQGHLLRVAGAVEQQRAANGAAEQLKRERRDLEPAGTQLARRLDPLQLQPPHQHGVGAQPDVGVERGQSVEGGLRPSRHLVTRNALETQEGREIQVLGSEIGAQNTLLGCPVQVGAAGERRLAELEPEVVEAGFLQRAGKHFLGLDQPAREAGGHAVQRTRDSNLC